MVSRTTRAVTTAIVAFVFLIDVLNQMVWGAQVSSGSWETGFIPLEIRGLYEQVIYYAVVLVAAIWAPKRLAVPVIVLGLAVVFSYATFVLTQSTGALGWGLPEIMRGLLAAIGGLLLAKLNSLIQAPVAKVLLYSSTFVTTLIMDLVVGVVGDEWPWEPVFVMLILMRTVLFVTVGGACVSLYELVRSQSEAKRQDVLMTQKQTTKPQLASKALAAGAALALASAFFGFHYLFGNLSGITYTSRYNVWPPLPQALFLMLVAIFCVWLPALVANRALAKGKSWDAFFWLSIFVSPLLMWIIAEASTDTRGMVYGAASQAPVQAYAHAAPGSYAPAAVPAAPVTASDTRECPECAETIKKAAKLCKHCGSKVTPIA